ncbi:hypothetical protein Nepgr_010812 [Nepenthes gracilis]|uniref:Sec-independent protein translocase protein TATB, chloroplastic n=1 Tax=Nepenthes gracilis TaxID=150966 RepID=A0AAD3SE50_NEPGR|nr:hypothetical protein Nepgr_010812 [Nepenthes gracilis]
MASPISTSTFCYSSSVGNSKSTMYSPFLSSSLYLRLNTPKISVSACCSQLDQCRITQWNGLRDSGMSILPKPLRTRKKGRCKGKVVHASLFGVGAPEALVIGVVALLVFGPKGLAEVARNLGKTLRAFQPTIRELQEVSREFKSTLEREIGLDDIPSSSQRTYGSARANPISNSSDSSSEESHTMADPNGAPPNRAYLSEEYLKITEEQLKASGALQQGVKSDPKESNIEPKSQPPAPVQESTTAIPPTQKPES